jgi:hypothetical protein
MTLLSGIRFCRQYTSLVTRPSLISRNSRSILLCHSFFYDVQRAGGKDITRGVRTLVLRANLKKSNVQIRSEALQISLIESVADKKIIVQKLQGDPDIQQKEREFKSQLEVDTFMKNNLHKCSKKDISDLLRISAKVSKKNNKISLLKNHIPAITSRIKELTHLDWTFQEISGVVYGLRYKTVDDVNVRDILSAMEIVTTKCIQNIKIMQSIHVQHISMLLYGFQNMHSSDKIIRNLLSMIAIMITRCSSNFDPQSVGNALYGLKCMKSDCPEVRDILSALCTKIHSCDKDLGSQEVSNALHGMKGMSSDCSEVRDVLSALSIKIRNCKKDFSSEAVGNALYGLQGMNSDYTEVRDVLSALFVKIRGCKEDLRSLDIGNALYGLQGMSGECFEVQNVLSALVAKINTCKESLGAQAAGNALYGLQGIKFLINSPDFSTVLFYLHRHISMITNNECRSKDLSVEMVQLKGPNRKERRELTVGNQIKSEFSASQKGTKSLITLCQSLTFFLSETSELAEYPYTMREYNDLKKMNAKIIKELGLRRKSGDAFYKILGSQSDIEKSLFDTIVKCTENTDIEVHANEYLFDIFDIDFILDIPSNSYNSGKTMKINIEVDGIRHKNKLFCERKDEYLKSRGVLVSRIDVDMLAKMSSDKLEEWILERISSAGLDNQKETV